jgi:Na+/H+ antiporter NhaD/arsenite permease-like protein
MFLIVMNLIGVILLISIFVLLFRLMRDRRFEQVIDRNESTKEERR